MAQKRCLFSLFKSSLLLGIAISWVTTAAVPSFPEPERVLFSQTQEAHVIIEDLLSNWQEPQAMETVVDWWLSSSTSFKENPQLEAVFAFPCMSNRHYDGLPARSFFSAITSVIDHYDYDHHEYWGNGQYHRRDYDIGDELRLKKMVKIVLLTMPGLGGRTLESLERLMHSRYPAVRQEAALALRLIMGPIDFFGNESFQDPWKNNAKDTWDAIYDLKHDIAVRKLDYMSWYFGAKDDAYKALWAQVIEAYDKQALSYGPRGLQRFLRERFDFPLNSCEQSLAKGAK